MAKQTKDWTTKQTDKQTNELTQLKLQVLSSETSRSKKQLLMALLFLFLTGIQLLPHQLRASLTHYILISAFLQLWPKGHWEPRNEVGFLSLAEQVVGFE